MMRRESFELQVSRPEIVTKDTPQGKVEPVEDVVIDVPEDFQGIVIASMGIRRGTPTRMVNNGGGRVRLEFRIPSRGLIGFRSQFLTDTRGTGIMNHLFAGWEPWHGPIAARAEGVLVSIASVCPPLRHRQPAGTRRDLHRPATEVYEGMISRELPPGRHGRQHHQGKEADEHGVSSGADEAIRLIPPKKLSLEQAIEFVNDDSWSRSRRRASGCARRSGRQMRRRRARVARRQRPAASVGSLLSSGGASHAQSTLLRQGAQDLLDTAGRQDHVPEAGALPEPQAEQTEAGVEGGTQRHLPHDEAQPENHRLSVTPTAGPAAA